MSVCLAVCIGTLNMCTRAIGFLCPVVGGHAKRWPLLKVLGLRTPQGFEHD